MKIKEIAKVGNGFTLPEFILKSGEMSGLFRRDELRLAPYGISSQYLTDYEQKVAELRVVPSDIEMENYKMKATESKNLIAEDVRCGLKKIVFFAKQVYEQDSAALALYLIGNLSKLSDADLLHFASVLANLTKLNIADFANVEITAEFCDNLISKCDTLNMQYAVIKNKIRERDKATEQRWIKANEVYTQMMKICEVGKFIWESESEACYNDYVVYPNSSSSTSTNEVVDEENPVTENPNGSSNG